MERTKFNISSLFQQRLKQAFLQAGKAEEKAEQNCAYRLDFNTPQGWLRVKQFTNGTLYLEATDSQKFAEAVQVVQSVTGEKAVVTPAKAKATSSSSSTTQSERGKIEIDVPYIGTDESGKGDYFGPLVIAGAYTTPQTGELLRSLGVMDSKLLKDAQMKILAVEIKQIIGPEAFEIIEISPKRYNELYDNFKKNGKNLNHLLAWGHAKVLENLLLKNPDCTHAIADQFGSEHFILSQLQTRGKQIQLHQTPKAEANIGVAAASILARARFVEKMKSMEYTYGVPIPLGANAMVLEKARLLVRKSGPDILKEVAKLHFKTTENVLAGL